MSRPIIQFVTVLSVLLLCVTTTVVLRINTTSSLRTNNTLFSSNNNNNDVTFSQRRLNAPNGAVVTSSASVLSNNFPMNSNDLTDKIMSRIETKMTTSIRDYLQSMKHGQPQMVLLKWNSDGILENTTGCDKHLDWIQQYYDGDFKFTSSSKYGKVALIYVSDVIYNIPWDTTAPIPVLLYTIEKEYLYATNYILAPNPYDQSGFSEFQVAKLFEKYKDTMTNTSYDTFHQRNNTLMWRGSDHGETIRANLIEFAEQQSSSSSFSSQPLSNLWLDAKLSGGDNDAVAGLTEEQLAGYYKYHLDVGGVSGTSWEGLRWKMCSGNLVFHIESGAIDWWHIHIKPGEHYINVNGDMSNLQEQYNWVESHPIEAYEIAQRGQKVCLQTYRKFYAAQRSMNIIQSLPDATLEQIQEADEILEDYYRSKNNQDE
jgi:Glycosyl transferase family 90